MPNDYDHLFKLLIIGDSGKFSIYTHSVIALILSLLSGVNSHIIYTHSVIALYTSIAGLRCKYGFWAFFGY